MRRIFLGVLFACALTPAVAAPPSDCAGMAAERDRLNAEIAQLEQATLPEEQIALLLTTLREIKATLSGTAKDGKSVAEKLRKQLGRLKKVSPAIADAVGKIADGVEKHSGTMGKVGEAIDRIVPVLEFAAKAFNARERGTAADQVRNLREALDGIRALPSGQLPGVKELLESYSTMIGSIAASVEVWEKRMDDFAREAKDADPLHRDFVIRAANAQERRSATIARLRDSLAALSAGMDKAGCGARPAVKPLCALVRQPLLDAIEAAEAQADREHGIGGKDEAGRSERLAGLRARLEAIRYLPVDIANQIERLDARIAAYRGPRTEADYHRERAALAAKRDTAPDFFDRQIADLDHGYGDFKAKSAQRAPLPAKREALLREIAALQRDIAGLERDANVRDQAWKDRVLALLTEAARRGGWSDSDRLWVRTCPAHPYNLADNPPPAATPSPFREGVLPGRSFEFGRRTDRCSWSGTIAFTPSWQVKFKSFWLNLDAVDHRPTVRTSGGDPSCMPDILPDHWQTLLKSILVQFDNGAKIIDTPEHWLPNYEFPPGAKRVTHIEIVIDGEAKGPQKQSWDVSL